MQKWKSNPMDAMKTRRADRYTNGADGRAHGALAKCVMGACVFNAALTAGACALAACWGCVLPALGLALACAVSAATFAALREGGAA